MASASTWVQASRPLAQVNIAIPLLVAQAAAWHTERALSWAVFGLVLAWGAWDALFIVYANDVADRHTDSMNRTAVSGGSGVLIEGSITVKALLRAAVIAACGVLVCSGVLALWGRPWALLGGVVAITLLWAYSFPPLRLCDSAAGEWLQAIGMGLGLPWLGYYAQSGVLLTPWWLLAPCFLLGFGSNLLTSMPDAANDTATGKRTWAVRHGVKSAKVVSALLIVSAAVIAALGTPQLIPQQRMVIALLPAVVLASTWRRRADPMHDSAFVWVGATALNLVLVLWGAFLALRSVRG